MTLVERSVDVAVKSVTASATEAVVGDTVDFTVTLENGGNVAAVTPAVSLFDANAAADAEALETVTADHNSRGRHEDRCRLVGYRRGGSRDIHFACGCNGD